MKPRHLRARAVAWLVCTAAAAGVVLAGVAWLMVTSAQHWTP
jgi:hypothetical protein